MISQRQIISVSDESIFAIFSPNESIKTAVYAVLAGTDKRCRNHK